MASSGILQQAGNHAESIILLACGMQLAMQEINTYYLPSIGVTLRRSHAAFGVEVRIGISSGPLIGGVVGRDKIMFDMWGATVEEAALLEQSGVPGQVHVSEETKDDFG